MPTTVSHVSLAPWPTRNLDPTALPAGQNRRASDSFTAIGSAIDAAEQQSGTARRDALNALAKQVDKDVSGAKDSERVKMLSSAIKDLAKATK